MDAEILSEIARTSYPQDLAGGASLPTEQIAGRPLPVTAISDYLFCPLHAYLKHVKGLRQPMTERSTAGFFKHELFKKLLRLESTIKPQQRSYDARELMRLIHEALHSLPFPPQLADMGLEWEDMLAQIMPVLMRIHGLWRKGHGMMQGGDMASRHFEVPLMSRRHGLRGRVDIIEANSPVEIKGGSVPSAGIYPSNLIQSAWYGLMIEEETGVRVERASVFYAMALERREFVLSHRLRAWALRVRSQALRDFSRADEEEITCYCQRIN